MNLGLLKEQAMLLSAEPSLQSFTTVKLLNTVSNNQVPPVYT